MVINMYKALITLSFPLIKATYIKKRQKAGKEHPSRFNERLGIYTLPRPEGKLYWMHGASVGESISMLPLIDKLLREDPNLSIMVTTGTLTSAEIMAKRLPPRAFHQFIPFDVPAFARNLINHFKPDAVMWFESELWPSLLSEIHNAGIPLILVNGRISDHSFDTWKKFKFVAQDLLNCFSLCLGQSEQDKERLIRLGAKNVDCVGNLKYAGMPLPVDPEKFKVLTEQIDKRRIFLISSTHNNEEEQLAAYLPILKENADDVLVIIAPRHPNRGSDITEMLRQKGFNVYVADTIGEMGLWYRLASVSFVGGSLIPHGGQNFMEPARDKNAVIVGPNMQNFVEMMDRAKANEAVLQKNSAEEVVQQVIALFNDTSLLAEHQQKAYDWTVKEATVLDGIAQALQKVLK